MIVIDTAKLGNNKVEDVLFLLLVNMGYGDEIEHPLPGLVKLNNDSVSLTNTGKKLLSKCVKRTDTDPIKDRWTSLAKKLRDVYPEGAMVCNGNKYSWRGSLTVVATRLKSYFEKTGREFTDDEAVAATKRYLESQGDKKRTLPKFIHKVNKETGEEDWLIDEWLDIKDSHVEDRSKSHQVVDDDFDDEDV